MIIHTEFQQHSAEWFLARAGIPTASELDQLLTPEFKVRTGEMPKTYLARKVAEAWIGGPLPGYSSFAMEQGSILEGEAIPWFELEYDMEISRVGFITTDDKRVGCSPDGLIGGYSGIEIKCPEVHTHTGYILNGVLPRDYACQVHGSMFVTGRPQWEFLSYSRGFPKLALTIHRDEEIQEQIAEAIAQFLERFDAAMDRMAEINGGPPPRAVPLTPFPPRVPRQEPVITENTADFVPDIIP